MTKGLWIGLGLGWITMLALVIVTGFSVSTKPTHLISQSVVEAGWGQSDGRVYRVTPAEVVPSQETRP